jgi:hypothetical protein
MTYPSSAEDGAGLLTFDNLCAPGSEPFGIRQFGYWRGNSRDTADIGAAPEARWMQNSERAGPGITHEATSDI